MHIPIDYDPRFEVPEDGEGDTQADLLDVLHDIADTTFRDTGQPLRSVHAKSHGLLRAELRVPAGLPRTLAQGLFGEPGTYPVVMRLSTTPGDLLPDDVSTPRGIGLKIIGVRGERLPGSENDITQDFVLVNATTFLNAGPKAFLGGLTALAATTDKAPALKQALSGALRKVEGLLEHSGIDSAGLKSLGGHPATHPLGDTYYSQTALLFGRYMAKVALAPVAVGLKQLHGATLDVKDHPDALRQGVCDYFAQQGGEWELRVQLCTNIEEMPIEDAAAEWPESVSPYVTVARIVAPPQVGWSDALSAAIDEGMSFSPWHGPAGDAPSTACARPRTRCRRGCADAAAVHPSRNRARSTRCPSGPDPSPVACYNARWPVRRHERRTGFP